MTRLKCRFNRFHCSLVPRLLPAAKTTGCYIGDVTTPRSELMFPPLLPTECGLLLGEDECATLAACAWADGVAGEPGSCGSARCDMVLEPIACLGLAPFLGCRFNSTFFFCHG